MIYTHTIIESILWYPWVCNHKMTWFIHTPSLSLSCDIPEYVIIRWHDLYTHHHWVYLVIYLSLYVVIEKKCTSTSQFSSIRIIAHNSYWQSANMLVHSSVCISQNFLIWQTGKLVLKWINNLMYWLIWIQGG
jgi:hypothetical protein